jgi:thioredoxin 2
MNVVCPHCEAAPRVPEARLADRPGCGKCKRPLSQGHPVAPTDQTFDRQLTPSDPPLVVDSWASWCGPCKMMAPASE